MTEKELSNLKPVPFTTETAREAQKKSVKSRLTKKAFVQEAMRQFHKGGRDKESFSALSDKASAGDVQAVEQLRKWIMEDEENGNKGTTINVIVSSQAEKDALDKWSE